jgi:hypothetical protein
MNKRLLSLGFLVFAFISILLTVGIAVGIRYNLSKSDWAAWVQAIGSIGAILAAVGVVQYQHRQQARLALEAKRIERRMRLNTLMAIFTAIGQIVDDCASKVNEENIAWWMQAERLKEAKMLLSSIPLFELPDHGVVLRFSEISEALQRAKAMADALSVKRSPEVREKIQKMISLTSVICRHGITDITLLLVECSTRDEIDSDMASYEQIEENAKVADDIWEKLQSKKRLIPSLS